MSVFAPRSIFGRNLLLIVVLMAIAQLISALLVRELIIRPRMDQAAESVARTVTAVRSGLLTLPVAERAGFVEAFNPRGEDALRPFARESFGSIARDRFRKLARDDVPRGLLRPGLTAPERRFVRAITERLAAVGAPAEWRREAGGGLGIRISVQEAAYWIVLPNAWPAREITGTWLAATGFAALLALVGAYAIQRRLNQPLAQVVKAADALAHGAPPSKLPEDGPEETASLARSFNQLVASLSRADRERALMLAGVSHDLRTPLTKLRLGVEILSTTSEPQLTASMTRSIEEMDAIVGQFLDFARADAAGDQAENDTRFDLDALVGRMAAAHADHGQRLQLVLGGSGVIRARETALHRAIGNLVENAFKHGRAPVSVHTGADALQAWVEVRDEGDGVSAAEAESLKQPFRRAQSSRSGAPGAGLGLSIVDRIVRAQGGRFELLPNTPRGLRARISLPHLG